MISSEKKMTEAFFCEYCCRNDGQLTILGNPEGLAVLLGFSVEEAGRLGEKGLWNFIKGDNRDILRRKLEQQLLSGDQIELIMPVCCQDGTVMWVVNRGCRVEKDGEEQLCGVLVDITFSKTRYDMYREETELLQEQVQRDSLTKVYNASAARKLAEEYLAECGTNVKSALLIVDLDNFKKINDNHGHMFGDAVLVQCAQIIRKLFRSKDIVGRIGGDEFLILMKDIPDWEIVKIRCNQMNESLKERFEEELAGCYPSCSIGAAFSPEQGNSYFHLFCCADQALYQAKASGRKQYVFYEGEGCKAEQNKSILQFANYDESVLRGYIE